MAAMALKPDEEKMFEGQPRGFPFGNFDISDVMLPEGDDMGIARWGPPAASGLAAVLPR